MIQGIMELIFDLAYFATALTVGILLVSKGKNIYTKLFGIMAIVLASGDSFHLVPRVYSLLTDTMAENAVALGFGQMVTSLTMTGFYVILYFIWEQRVKSVSAKQAVMGLSNASFTNGSTNYNFTLLRIVTISLATIRIALCFFPQNNWFSADGNLTWGILRNIPFAIMGIVIIVLCFMHHKQTNDKDYLYMAIAVIFSFAFYIPVVLWSSTIPAMGVLMIPKTLAYVLIVIIGLLEHRKDTKVKNNQN